MKKSLKIIILVNLIIIVGVVGFIVVKGLQKPDNNSVTGTSEVQSNTKLAVSEPSIPSGTAPVVSNTESPVVAVPDNRCIITILGKKYDVTDYRNMHPGGNVFTCGTDMTTTFNNQHGADMLKKAAKYLIN